ncbi:extracellular solute-binding protein [Streptomyces globisporus]|uniref:extracellular solute-binding protein n=1 Tax=Streptomyces globisporus TaxID=1908 RepID=UPI00368A83B0
MQAPEPKNGQTPEQPQEERIILDVWLADYPFPTYDGRDFLAPLRERAAEFERTHPRYRVDITGHDFWTMPEKVARAAAEGRPPHIAGYYATDSQLARDARNPDGSPVFTSVEAALAGRTEILGHPVVVDDLDPTVRDSYSFGGELISLPFTVTTMLCYANASLLERAGVPEPPRTWDGPARPWPASRAVPVTGSPGPTTAGCSSRPSPCRTGCSPIRTTAGPPPPGL